jgi:hypothetical protein
LITSIASPIAAATLRDCPRRGELGDAGGVVARTKRAPKHVAFARPLATSRVRSTSCSARFYRRTSATTLSPWVITLEAMQPFHASFTRPPEDPQLYNALGDRSASDPERSDAVIESRRPARPCCKFGLPRSCPKGQLPGTVPSCAIGEDQSCRSHSGNPASRSPSANRARSSGRWIGSQSLRLEARSDGSSVRTRCIACFALSIRPASA